VKKSMKKLIVLSLVAALVVTGFSTGSTYTAAAPKAKKIVMNKKKITINVGEKFKLKVKKVKPSKAGKKVKYRSKDVTVAKVSKKGVVEGRSIGKTKIVVTSKKNKKAKATVKVVVKAPSTPVTDSPVPTAYGPTVAPTEPPVIVEATDVPETSTPKPTRTPRPTLIPATATPVPTVAPTPTVPEAKELPADSIITNGDFNDDTTGWSKESGAGSIKVVEGSNNYLAYTGRWNQWSTVNHVVTGEFVQNGKIKVTADIYSADSSAQKAQIDVQYTDGVNEEGEDNVITLEKSFNITAGTWNTVSAAFALPKDVSEVVIRIGTRGSTWEYNGDYYLDNVYAIYEKPVEVIGSVSLDLTDASLYTVDDDVTASYNEEENALDVNLPGSPANVVNSATKGITFTVPEEYKDYAFEYVAVSVTSKGKTTRMNLIDKNGIMGSGYVEATSGTEMTIQLDKDTAGVDRIQAIKLFRDFSSASTTQITAIEFFYSDTTSPVIPAPEGRLYSRINSVSDIQDGDKILMIYNGDRGSGSEFMLPKVVEISGSSGLRVGFSVENTGISMSNVIGGNYEAKEWTFTKDGDGWRVGTVDGYIKLTDERDANISYTARLDSVGDILAIGGSANAFTFTTTDGLVINRNTTRALLMGYPTDAATFVLYRYSGDESTEEPPTPTEPTATEVPIATPEPTPVMTAPEDKDAPEGNIVGNGCFDEGTNGWTTNGGNLVVENIDGNNICKITGRYNQHGNFKKVIEGDFKEGDVISLSYDVYTDDPIANSCWAMLGYAGEEKTNNEKIEISCSEWQSLQHVFVIEEDTNQIELQIRVQAYESEWIELNSDYYLDNVFAIHKEPVEVIGSISLDLTDVSLYTVDDDVTASYNTEDNALDVNLPGNPPNIVNTATKGITFTVPEEYSGYTFEYVKLSVTSKGKTTRMNLIDKDGNMSTKYVETKSGETMSVQLYKDAAGVDSIQGIKLFRDFSSAANDQITAIEFFYSSIGNE